jgi:hypothetical protein
MDKPRGHYGKWNKLGIERWILHDLTYSRIGKKQTHRNRVKRVLWGVRSGDSDMLIKGYKLSVTRWVSYRDLMHSMVIIVNNTILFIMMINIFCSTGEWTQGLMLA